MEFGILLDIVLGGAFLYGFWTSPGWDQKETKSDNSDDVMLGAIWGYKAGEEIWRDKK
jgi:hypothetical protein